MPYPVLATATSGGDTAPRWALFSSTATRIDELQGKKLSIAASGPRDAEFASNALFDGEVQVGKFFAAQNKAPDLASAVAAVSLKKADAVFAPEAAGQGAAQAVRRARPRPQPRVLRSGRRAWPPTSSAR